MRLNQIIWRITCTGMCRSRSRSREVLLPRMSCRLCRLVVVAGVRVAAILLASAAVLVVSGVEEGLPALQLRIHRGLRVGEIRLLIPLLSLRSLSREALYCC
jgi:hypothetical protein